MYLLLKIFPKNTEYSVATWFDKLSLPMVVFHFFGRIGCFFGGCCYGRETDSVLGVIFPDNIENGIVHAGEKCYPTQLFEAFLLLLIFIVLLYAKHRFKLYLFLYAVGRFFLEFLRGDERGSSIFGLSPSQTISIAILVFWQ